MSMEKIAEEKRELIRYLTKLAAARIIEDEMLKSWIKSSNEEGEKTASTDQEQALAYLVQLGAETFQKQAQVKNTQEQVLQELLKRALAEQLQKEAAQGKDHDPATNARQSVDSLLGNVEDAGGIGSQVDPYTSAVNKLTGYLQSNAPADGNWSDFLNRKGSAINKKAAQQAQVMELFKQAGIQDQIKSLMGIDSNPLSSIGDTAEGIGDVGGDALQSIKDLFSPERGPAGQAIIDQLGLNRGVGGMVNDAGEMGGDALQAIKNLF